MLSLAVAARLSTHRKSLILNLTPTTPTLIFEHQGKKLDIDLADMDYVSWREKLVEDSETLELLSMIEDITPEFDRKLQTLIGIISDKIRPFNPGNKKVLLFSAFSDTVDYLYSQIAPAHEAAVPGLTWP